MSDTIQKKDLLCENYKREKSKFRYYRGFELSTLKLLVEYTFTGFLITIKSNYRERRFDICLYKKNKETGEDIDLNEVEKFRKFYGSGFNILLMDGDYNHL